MALVALEVAVPAEERNNIQGTATCLPPVELALLAAPPLEVLLADPLEVPVEELVPLGLVAAPVLLGAVNDKTAKSIRPEAAFTIISLIVPTPVPELPETVAPVNWLPLIS